MSVLVIKRGVKNKPIKYVTNCKACHSTLVYEESDVTPDLDLLYTIRCPECCFCTTVPMLSMFRKKYKEVNDEHEKCLCSDIKNFLK